MRVPAGRNFSPDKIWAIPRKSPNCHIERCHWVSTFLANKGTLLWDVRDSQNHFGLFQRKTRTRSSIEGILLHGLLLVGLSGRLHLMETHTAFCRWLSTLRVLLEKGFSRLDVLPLALHGWQKHVGKWLFFD